MPPFFCYISRHPVLPGLQARPMPTSPEAVSLVAQAAAVGSPLTLQSWHSLRLLAAGVLTLHIDPGVPLPSIEFPLQFSL